jgi:hypothetical protein
MKIEDIKNILEDHQQDYIEENGQIIVLDRLLNCNTTPPTPEIERVNVTEYTKKQLFKFLGY